MELIFKIICCSAVFIGFYHFILQREKMFRFNRFYLIATLILSFTIPFMELGIREFSAPQLEEFIPQIPQKTEVSTSIPDATTAQIPITKSVIPIVENQAVVSEVKTIPAFSWIEILGIVGLLISSILLIRFIINLFKINYLVYNSEKINKEGFTLVKINQNVSPFSFFHYLFASKQDVENEKIQSEIFYHEFAHIKQKHTLDVVFVEFLMIFFWFNPFLYIYRKSIRTNHEFLADEEVLNHHFDTTAYQHLLLEKIPVKSQTSLSSSFNYLVTKKRLIMMTKQTSKLKTTALKFFSIPLLVTVMLIFSEKVSAQIEPGKGVSKELFREYKKQVRKATVTVKDENGNKRKEIDASKLDQKLMAEVYAKMTPEQKMKVTPILSKTIAFNGMNDLVLDLSSLDGLANLGLDAGDLGIKIAGEVLSNLNLKDLENLNVDVEYFNSPEWEAKIAEIEKNAAEIERYYNSPEWKSLIGRIEKNGAELERYYNSPEWKSQVEKMEKNAREIENYHNSPEWKNYIEQIEKNAREIEKFYNSHDYKNHIDIIEKNARKIEEGARKIEKYYDSPEFKNKIKEIERKAEEMAKEAEKKAKRKA